MVRCTVQVAHCIAVEVVVAAGSIVVVEGMVAVDTIAAVSYIPLVVGDTACTVEAVMAARVAVDPLGLPQGHGQTVVVVTCGCLHSLKCFSTSTQHVEGMEETLVVIS